MINGPHWAHFESHENVKNHEFQDLAVLSDQMAHTRGPPKMRNVFPVISVQSILSQLPYGAFSFRGPVFPFFSKIILAPIGSPFGL